LTEKKKEGKERKGRKNVGLLNTKIRGSFIGSEVPGFGFDAQKAIDQRIIGLSSRSGVHIALSIFLVQTGDGVGFIRIGDPQASERLWQ